MTPQMEIELLKLIPNILWIVLVLVLFAVFYKPIRYELLPRLGSFKAFGVEFTFIHDEIDKSAERWNLDISGSDRSLVIRRAQRLAPILQGAQVLWVDDHPDYNVYERRILNSLGIFVDLAKTSAEGLSMLSQNKYDLVISDIKREGVGDVDGFQFLDKMIEDGYDHKVIYYIGNLDKKRGVPPYAFGITDRPDHLLHLIFDALERERS